MAAACQRSVLRDLVKSMTGYGRGDGFAAQKKITVELKSVNNRFTEVVVRMPKHLLPLEERVKKTVQDRVSRGRVDVFITLEEAEEKKRLVKVDKELGLAYYNALRELADTCGIPEKFDLVSMASMPGMLVVEAAEDDLETMWPAIQEATGKALDALVAMRQAEGQKLAEDLLKRREIIGAYVADISQRAPQVVSSYQEKLRGRIQELLGETQIDENKLANEVAFFADRASITEELVRLDSHLQQMAEIIGCEDAVGRKLDFLGQEMNREINTIGSKANDLAISRQVLEVKSELEKVREQVQNLE